MNRSFPSCHALSRRQVVCFAALCLVASWGRTAAADGPPPPDDVEYNRDVRPILSKNCFPCHGTDESKRARGLRLDLHDEAVKTLKSGETAITPGDPDSSALLDRLIEEDETLRMPPKKTGPRLSPDEIAILRKWIEKGAKYAEHWALIAPKAVEPPKVADASWPRGGLDRFILARIERAGLKPSPEADRATLLRRVSLDLRGLPPTPQELKRFLDDDAPGAYERAVDRFLDDPSFGERWARMWLDLARYADSAGYGSDPLRTIWGYRDWVVNAFNTNKPYDQFTVEQIAGDLLPNSDVEQKLATAFHRNTMTNTEGGTDDEEFRIAAIKDRVDTTMQVWMGLTMGCAKCHTHKYDPITHDDYYSFFAIFNQTADNDQPDESPVLPLPSPEAHARIKEIDAQIAALRPKLDAPIPNEAEARAKWEAGLTASPDHEPARKDVPKDVLAIVDLPASKRSPEQIQALVKHYLSIAPELKPVRDEIAKLEKSKPEIPTLPVMVELPKEKRRITKVLLKGNFLDPGNVVEAAVPKALHPMPSNAPVDRLAVAKWLVDRNNPLTARVAVNRYWAQLFGAGIVETEEDFGTQGELPSHPELLDWLAVEFMDSGWNVKAMIRRMVVSATYRQSSKVTAEHLARDPKNRLLARAPRIRLEAEMVRDQALALSGLLDRKIGGPSVFPPQPDGLWQAAFNGQRTWATSPGGDKHRRALYTFWRRTIPYPSMAAFDAPSREICAIKRVRTNTPLQALVTLNDPVYIEAAQALARRIVREGGAGVDDRVRYALELCTGRPARPEQVAQVVALYNGERARYADDKAAALSLATEPLGPLPDGADPAELAGWTAVANVLLNLDAVLTRG
ncbi:PSD1 and planctomycete cytochrome C domain-containing protein [Paludisphaera borealis]|uniref:Cytochrome c domain-containing protein n=1 Tax=Paludisphaera borealis TaxID=1387353 RepID=A0A1U7CT29_9BACT|nr:PSD1 and planctomycete cytochrome C domain-containing protein [Paludisphaera borealis]APW62033.1 hypothetical protein BSF38_03565 [Paludisphaera borealis]